VDLFPSCQPPATARRRVPCPVRHGSYALSQPLPQTSPPPSSNRTRGLRFGDGTAHPFSSIHPHTAVTHRRRGWVCCLGARPQRAAGCLGQTDGLSPLVLGRRTARALLRGPERDPDAPQPPPAPAL